MTHEVRAVVATAKKAPVGVETIGVPDPGPGEALVRVKACGVCHTDLHYREGGINDEFPFLLGHEATGEVESVGDGVTEVAPGDRVILNWRAVCGQCRACRRGLPWYCFDTHNAAQPMTLEDGTALSPAARHSIASETLAILTAPEFAPLFGPQSRAEVPIVALIPNPKGKGPPLKLIGQLDRLVDREPDATNGEGPEQDHADVRQRAHACMVARQGMLSLIVNIE